MLMRIHVLQVINNYVFFLMHIGTYSNELDNSGFTSGEACTACPAGYMCAEGANEFTNPMQLCPVGHVCPGSSEATIEYVDDAGDSLDSTDSDARISYVPDPSVRNKHE
jgi:hypothetical protein